MPTRCKSEALPLTQVAEDVNLAMRSTTLEAQSLSPSGPHGDLHGGEAAARMGRREPEWQRWHEVAAHSELTRGHLDSGISRNREWRLRKHETKLA